MPEDKTDRRRSCFSHSFRRLWFKGHVNSLLTGAVLGATVTIVVTQLQFTWGKLPHTSRSRGTELLQPPNQENVQATWSNCRDLVMVAGHSVFTGANFEDADEASAPWILLSYQKKQLGAYLNHIRTGVEIAAKNNEALLVFSGGETRISGGPRSEGQSYWWVADAHTWFGHGARVRDRAITEEHARDSFENLLFSVCRFREIVGRYPETITVVSFTFKRKRFETVHSEALRWPSSKFRYVGMDMDDMALPKDVHKFEYLNSLKHFKSDPYGCKGVLAEKKAQRNPFKRQIPYPEGCPEIRALFSYCGETPFNGPLPWRT